MSKRISDNGQKTEIQITPFHVLVAVTLTLLSLLKSGGLYRDKKVVS